MERATQVSHREQLEGVQDDYLESTLASLELESRRLAESYLQRLHALDAQSEPIQPSERPSDTRTHQLLRVLHGFAGTDWEAIQVCSQDIDRPSVLGAARAATRIIGIDSAHELLLSITPSLGLAERSPNWDVVSWAILAAAAWDNLDNVQRTKLLECLVDRDVIQRLIGGWRMNGG